MSGSDLLALAEKSAETDFVFLLQAKEQAKKRMKENPSPENISAFKRARDAVSAETSRVAAPSPLRVCKTQREAVAFLADRGFKVSKSAFCRDLKAGKLSTDANGHFEENALLAYAVGLKEATAKVENKALATASMDRLSADAELKSIQAARQKLRLEKEQGRLMARADHESDLAARALFFRREVENFIRLHGPGTIHLVGGDEKRLPDLVAFWEEATADWMNAWAMDREFFTPEENEDEEATDAGSEAAEESAE
ncbi:MAG: hypothetical protein FWG17_03110 [Desulfovibrionaceae bacterium]|nr:hypothetical protein [Desulfovibrionaceae bacterium]